MLLIKPDSIPAVVAAEPDRLNPGKIVILGGGTAISAAVEPAADVYTDNPVEQIEGENCYGKARLIAEANLTPGVDVV